MLSPQPGHPRLLETFNVKILEEVLSFIHGLLTLFGEKGKVELLMRLTLYWISAVEMDIILNSS